MLTFSLRVLCLPICLENSYILFNAHLNITAIVKLLLTSHLLPLEKVSFSFPCRTWYNTLL